MGSAHSASADEATSYMGAFEAALLCETRGRDKRKAVAPAVAGFHVQKLAVLTGVS